MRQRDWERMGEFASDEKHGFGDGAGMHALRVGARCQRGIVAARVEGADVLHRRAQLSGKWLAALPLRVLQRAPCLSPRAFVRVENGASGALENRHNPLMCGELETGAPIRIRT